MPKNLLFEWLVNYHFQVNLENSIPYMRNGQVCDEEGTPHAEGSDKSMPYQGVLIVANGDTLVDRLKKDKVVHDEQLGSFVKINNEHDFRKYIKSLEEDDGAYIYDSVNRRIIHVEEINNDHDLPDGKSMYDMIPKNFFSYDSNLEAKLGTKTRLAIKIPHAYDNTESFQIKRSAYGPMRMGKVTHFNKQGLVEEFFMIYNPESKGPFVNPKHKITGVYRKYERDKDNNLVKVTEKYYKP